MKPLRQICRENRRQLSSQQQIAHAKQATSLFLRSHWCQRPQKIALFLAQDGELSTNRLAKALLKRGHKIYLPVLNTLRGRDMAFAPFEENTQMKPNQFGILEPMVPHQHHLTGKQLSLVLMPLTCFDEDGNRIGMGGGFYDKTFAFKQHLKHTHPKLIGWAHECQKVSSIPTEKWDIPLDGLVSEKKIYFF